MAEITIPENELSEFDLPRVCVVTGASQDVVFKDVKFQWFPRWVAVFILFNVIIFAVIALILTKRVKGKLPFTEDAFSAWKRGQLFFGLSIFGAIVLFIAGIMVMAAMDSPVGLLVWVAAIALPVFVGIKFVKGKSVSCTRIADGQVTLKIPSDSAAQSLRDHLQGGARRAQLAARQA